MRSVDIAAVVDDFLLQRTLRVYCVHRFAPISKFYYHFECIL